jgi:hypothetical protein
MNLSLICSVFTRVHPRPILSADFADYADYENTKTKNAAGNFRHFRHFGSGFSALRLSVSQGKKCIDVINLYPRSSVFIRVPLSLWP